MSEIFFEFQIIVPPLTCFLLFSCVLRVCFSLCCCSKENSIHMYITRSMYVTYFNVTPARRKTRNLSYISVELKISVLIFFLLNHKIYATNCVVAHIKIPGKRLQVEIRMVFAALYDHWIIIHFIGC